MDHHDQSQTETPVCFIMTLDEVKELCHHSDPAKSRTGAASIWLQPSAYDQPQFREAWHRFETLNSIDVPKTVILPA